MKKKHKINYLPIAQQDLIDIFDYIREDNPTAAAKFIDKIDKSISKLELFPKLGVVPKDDRLEFFGYRMLVIDSYLVFYVIIENIVEIRRIIRKQKIFFFIISVLFKLHIYPTTGAGLPCLPFPWHQS